MVRFDLHSIESPSTCGIERLLFGLLQFITTSWLWTSQSRKRAACVLQQTYPPHQTGTGPLAGWALARLTPFACVYPLGLHTTNCPGFACAAFRFRWASRRAEEHTTRALQLQTRIVEAARFDPPRRAREVPRRPAQDSTFFTFDAVNPYQSYQVEFRRSGFGDEQFDLVMGSEQALERGTNIPSPASSSYDDNDSYVHGK
ncbi:hypothetical protein B0H65DRAFT_276430 [Neurospora tetraspora]|uniref:Uncharacterized protein n=1 Tax=Neurospora tetraspora TaxID=94610 RepID=A0AAE0JBH3_9PEZI|nr:hypothetical protein B0H65DRAFT_276430 [Neurospora tetraspora]